MSAEILISVRPTETRVAYVENATLSDLSIERKTTPTMVGSIHRGKVMRVLPGMQAAFVDIGMERAAFLYVGDVRGDLEADGEFDDEFDEETNKDKDVSLPKIEDLIKEGQELLVQVAKDPIGTKGARITTHISLPGRHVVYMPTIEHFGVSRRIEDQAERDRLRTLVEGMKPQGGIIVRTAGEGATEADLRRDLDYLHKLWVQVEARYTSQTKPGLVHAEMDVELRALRDLLNEDVRRVVVDNMEVKERVEQFIRQFMPQYADVVKLHTDEIPLFDLYDIDLEVSRATARKVWLKSGGYIVIDEAEALVVIDVNTGRFVGKKNFEETILKTNLEAAKEIAHQIRIRNCGGIIIVDFIDMAREAHREKVLSALREEVVRDRARTNIISMSSLGLVEMTRKRIRPSLLKMLCEPCSYCEGRGFVKQHATVAHEIFYELERDRRHMGGKYQTKVSCHPQVADWIFEEGGILLDEAEQRLGHPVSVVAESQFHLEQFEVTHSKG
jgi:ribonuclease G